MNSPLFFLPSLQSLVTTNLLPVSMDSPILDISYKKNHTTWGLFVFGFFNLASCFKGLSMSWHVSVIQSFLIAKHYSIVWIDHILFLQSLI